MSKKKNNIVLIDDDRWLLDLYGEKLRMEDFVVHTATNGKEGYELITKHKPDIILSDVVMAGGDGFTLLRNVRKNKDLDDVPVIILTNLSSDMDREELEKSGSNGYLVKSDFTPSQVVDKIRKIIDKFEVDRK